MYKGIHSYQSKQEEGPRRPKCLIRLSPTTKKLTHAPIAMIRTMMTMMRRMTTAMYNIAVVKEMPKCGFGFVTWCLFGCGCPFLTRAVSGYPGCWECLLGARSPPFVQISKFRKNIKDLFQSLKFIVWLPMRWGMGHLGLAGLVSIVVADSFW